MTNGKKGKKGGKKTPKPPTRIAPPNPSTSVSQDQPSAYLPMPGRLDIPPDDKPKPELSPVGSISQNQHYADMWGRNPSPLTEVPTTKGNAPAVFPAPALSRTSPNPFLQAEPSVSAPKPEPVSSIPLLSPHTDEHDRRSGSPFSYMTDPGDKRDGTQSKEPRDNSDQLRALRNPVIVWDDGMDASRLEPVRINIASCQQFDQHPVNDELGRTMARILMCRTLASRGLGRPIREKSRALTRTELRTTFKNEMEALTVALNDVWEYQLYESDPENVGLRLDQDNMKNLTSLLYKVLMRAKDGLLLQGKGIPDLPIWGKDGRWTDIWEPIDFEILGVAYRSEVEIFLATLGDALAEMKRLSREITVTPTQVLPSVTTQPLNHQPAIDDELSKPRSVSEAWGFRANPSTKASRNEPEAPKKQAGTTPYGGEGPSIYSQPYYTPYTAPRKDYSEPKFAHFAPAKTNDSSYNIPPHMSSNARKGSSPKPQAPQALSAMRPVPVRDATPATFTDHGRSNNPFVTAAPTPSTAGTLPPSYSNTGIPPPRANLNASMFGLPPLHSSSNRIKELLEPITFQEDDKEEDDRDRRGKRGKDYHDEPPSSSSSEDEDGRKGKGRRGATKRGPKGTRSGTKSNDLRFDYKLKVESIPTWDGNPDSLGRWIMKINTLARQSEVICKQLGHIVPSRLTGSAENWYYSLSSETRNRLERNWNALREGISGYFMNRAWNDRMKIKANKASYRDSGNPRESPSDYCIRKIELLQAVYNYNDRELISEIMEGTPSTWTTILTPHLYYSIEDFQQVVKFHEETLLQIESPVRRNPFFPNQYSRNPYNSSRTQPQAKVNAVGWTDSARNPPFPKDDTNVSKRATPESKNARPCRHCGSGKHWDPECKYSRKGEKRARANFVSRADEDTAAQDEYDELYFGLTSEDEVESDFH